MKPHRIILIRHGECYANTDESKFATEPDYTIELTEKGIQQAQEAGKNSRNCWVRNPPIFISPLFGEHAPPLNGLPEA